MYLNNKNIPSEAFVLTNVLLTYIGSKKESGRRLDVRKRPDREYGEMLYSELKCKDVINTRDCKKLGRVCDLEFDPCSGCISKIMVPGCNKILNFLNCEPNIVIPFKNICQIGPDIILVDIPC